MKNKSEKYFPVKIVCGIMLFIERDMYVFGKKCKGFVRSGKKSSQKMTGVTFLSRRVHLFLFRQRQ